MTRAPLPTLPVDAGLPELRRALAAATACVLEAPPGAGKTTRVPVALLEEPWLQGRKILMLEPRRVAARAAAARMAEERCEEVGATIGYRVRLDSKVGPKTRIEVLTEGLLTRRLQSDPALEGVGLLIFDEFHERSLNADLGLALALECQGALNEDLKILVMSATLDGTRVSKLLGDAPIVRAEGRLFPIETRYNPLPSGQRPSLAWAQILRRVLQETEGGILMFLPGEGEIRQVMRAFQEEANDASFALMPLFGALSPADQDAAIRPSSAGKRKVVLATAIAETSLTIEDVRVVIDSGLQRLAKYDPATGLTRLITQTVSLASADQRRGRAGRVAPGVCYRLWPEASTRALQPYTPPEILVSDLAPLALDLAQWGTLDPSSLALLDRPPAAAYAEALALLRDLEALDKDNRITAHGKAIAGFGAHPRLAHMMVRGAARGEGATAAALAAILSERDVIRQGGVNGRDADLRLRLEVFAGEHQDPRADRGALARAREQAKVWTRQLQVKERVLEPSATGRLTALAYPERIAKKRAQGSFRLRSGRGAMLPETDPLAGEDFLAIAGLDGAEANAKVYLAAPLKRHEVEDLFACALEERFVTGWDMREKAVAARRELVLGALVLEAKPLPRTNPAETVAAVIAGIKDMGLDCLPWTGEANLWRTRIDFVRKLEPDAGWPDVSDQALLASLGEWLAPYLDGITRASHFPRIDLLAALKATLEWQESKRLDDLAPTHITVPSGSRIPILYESEGPILAVRLQEMFGLAETPRIGNGRVPLTLQLLSPARRPVQVTRDLKSFWAIGYAEVKKDLKGRYPKHFWPDDPWTAQASARTKPKR